MCSTFVHTFFRHYVTSANPCSHLYVFQNISKLRCTKSIQIHLNVGNHKSHINVLFHTLFLFFFYNVNQYTISKQYFLVLFRLGRVYDVIYRLTWIKNNTLPTNPFNVMADVLYYGTGKFSISKGSTSNR